MEGKFLLASEGSDLELEVLGRLRDTIKRDIGDVVVGDAFKITELSPSQLLVSPGEAWFRGLPYQLRFATDELVSGSNLSSGLLPAGVTITDDATGRGKLINFTLGTTPTGLYRVVITASEQIITSVQDPFLQDVNIAETTAQKIRILYRINVVLDSAQSTSPIPYTNETTQQNLANDTIITPTFAGNGHLISTASVSGATSIDGRKFELTIRNDPGLGGGNPIPNGSSDQASFSNGTLIDSYGGIYHINAIFNDVVSTQVIIRIDSEIGQPAPQIVDTVPYTITKRDVFVQDDTSGTPLGNLFFHIAKVDFNSASGVEHQSHITDLRPRKINDQQYQVLTNEKFAIEVVSNANISADSTGSVLTWDAAFSLVNPFTPSQSIPAASAALVDGGFLLYSLNMSSGGTIARGSLALTATTFGSTVSFSGSPSLASVRIGNVLKTSADTVVITAIDDVNKNVTVSPATTMSGSVTVYLDSFGPLTAIQDENAFVLATRSGTNLWVLETKLAPSQSTAFGSGVPTFTANRVIQSDSTGKLTDNSATATTLVADSLQRAKSASPTSFIQEEYLDSTTLTDNSGPTTAFSFAHASFAGLEISYTIETGAGTPDIRLGTLRVVSNGTSKSITDSFGETLDVGVSWSASISGPNTLIQYTTTNQGSNRTMRADIKRFRR